jgi:hypothetical protein
MLDKDKCIITYEFFIFSAVQEEEDIAVRYSSRTGENVGG